MTELLIVDDDRIFAQAAASLARDCGVRVRQAHTVAQAREALSRRRTDLLALDLQLPDGSGFELLETLTPAQCGRVVVITGHPSMDSAVRAVSGPITDYLLKPLCLDRWDALLRDALAASDEGVQANDALALLLGESPAMQGARDLLARVAPSGLSVMLSGETGTGKELAARALHEMSRRPGAFVAINCGAVSPELLGSQLFGHERGSFTGALARHIGCLERASYGTVFLDEITEMPMAVQPYLLRALETGMVTRLGGSGEVAAPVRVIAATNRDPAEAVADGRLRQDLYYRLADVCVHMPALRERGDDARLLAQGLLDRLNAKAGVRKYFSSTSLQCLAQHDWPGNVRELHSAVHRAFLLSDFLEIDIEVGLPARRRIDMPDHIRFRMGDTLATLEERAYGGPWPIIATTSPLLRSPSVSACAPSTITCHGGARVMRCVT